MPFYINIYMSTQRIISWSLLSKGNWNKKSEWIYPLKLWHFNNDIFVTFHVDIYRHNQIRFFKKINLCKSIYSIYTYFIGSQEPISLLLGPLFHFVCFSSCFSTSFFVHPDWTSPIRGGSTTALFYSRMYGDSFVPDPVITLIAEFRWTTGRTPPLLRARLR